LDDPETFSFLLKSLKIDKIRAKQLKVHSFVKAEQYPGFKMPRSINGRVDFSKIIFGPLVKTVEKIVYNNPCFIKNVPVNDRPQYITEKISGPGKYIATDYTSYESSFGLQLCVSVEYEIYRFVLNGFYAELICKSFYMLNVCVFRFFTIKVLAKRMSGDMNTSLGNGVTNVIVIMHIMYTNFKFILIRIVVEGDDSLFEVPLGCVPTTEMFAQYGLIVKIEEHTRLSTASFCGMVFDEVALSNLVDPGRVLRRGGYIDNKFASAKNSTKMSLVRAYGFSTYYQFHDCPVVSSFARMLLRVSRGVHVNKRMLNVHKFAESEVDSIPLTEERMFALYPPNRISLGSREIVHSLYKYSYDDQIWCENYLDSINTAQPLIMPVVVANSPQDSIDYFHHCSAFVGDNPNHMEPPPRVNFRDLVDELNGRFKAVTRLYSLPVLHENDNDTVESTLSSATPYWNDLFHGIRERLELQPAAA